MDQLKDLNATPQIKVAEASPSNPKSATYYQAKDQHSVSTEGENEQQSQQSAGALQRPVAQFSTTSELTEEDQDVDGEFTSSQMRQRAELQRRKADTIVVEHDNLPNNFQNKQYLKYLKKETFDFENEQDCNVVIHMLKKTQKQMYEIAFLKKAMQGLQLFQKHNYLFQAGESSKSLWKQIGLSYYRAREVLFNFGDYGDHYYVVLKGSCDLLVPAQPQTSAPVAKNAPATGHSQTGGSHQRDEEKARDSTKNPEKTDNANPPLQNNETDQSTIIPSKSRKSIAGLPNLKKFSNPTTQPNQFSLNNIPEEKQQSNTGTQSMIIRPQKASVLLHEPHEAFLKRCFPGMVYITTFKPGSSFGEIALLTKQRRTGTVVARENCYCMTLNRESFTQIMGAYNDYVVNNKLLFFSSFPFFSGIPNNRLLQLMHSIREMTLKHRQVVYEEGDQVDGFYLIRKGMVEHSKVVEIEPEQPVRGIERINRQNIIKQKRRRLKRVTLLSQSEGQWFGEDELLEGLQKRKHRVICADEQSEIVFVDKEILFTHTKNYGTLQLLKKFFQQKKQWNVQRVNAFKNEGIKASFAEVDSINYHQQHNLGSKSSTNLITTEISLSPQKPQEDIVHKENSSEEHHYLVRSQNNKNFSKALVKNETIMASVKKMAREVLNKTSQRQEDISRDLESLRFNFGRQVIDLNVPSDKQQMFLIQKEDSSPEADKSHNNNNNNNNVSGLRGGVRTPSQLGLTQRSQSQLQKNLIKISFTNEPLIQLTGAQYQVKSSSTQPLLQESDERLKIQAQGMQNVKSSESFQPASLYRNSYTEVNQKKQLIEQRLMDNNKQDFEIENLAEAFSQEITAYRRETFKSMYRRSLLKPSASLKQFQAAQLKKANTEVTQDQILLNDKFSLVDKNCSLICRSSNSIRLDSPMTQKYLLCPSQRDNTTANSDTEDKLSSKNKLLAILSKAKRLKKPEFGACLRTELGMSQDKRLATLKLALHQTDCEGDSSLLQRSEFPLLIQPDEGEYYAVSITKPKQGLSTLFQNDKYSLQRKSISLHKILKTEISNRKKPTKYQLLRQQTISQREIYNPLQMEGQTLLPSSQDR